ncbi:T9SS type B sorting domain-containing protein [Flavobacterium sp. TP390]|uniref:T9SS type B sorting domain-containing protein n=1 Tax=Flavobacterium profundi TaxID=1774945 RepID=A0A6I4IUA1_9FLAO|nr:T9SS type B sorting domain-containing protein [Flavobacterium profundi]MVO10450.1 T9SS type B sorting domain-containing protein [Flavobacterium profundi]
MKAFYVLVFLINTSIVFAQKQTTSIGFIENKGQIVDQKGKENSQVKYLLNTNGLNVQLREKGFSYDVYETERLPLTKKDKEFKGSNPSFDTGIKNPDYSLKYNFHRIDIDFLNSNKNVTLVSEEKSADYDNYYNVAHAPDGKTQVHKYQKVTYQNIYTNIDVVFFIPKDSTKVVEYNFIVKPGGKVSDIQLQFKGGKTELIDNKIRMHLRFGQMEETLPLSWIEDKNAKKEIALHYKKIKKNVFGFDGDINHSNKVIVIDPVPVRLWGTYYGGSGDELPSTLTTNQNNDVYISGTTNSIQNIATLGTHQSSLIASWNIFITKFDTNGIRIWGTYFYSDFGQTNIQSPYIKVDSQNNVYLAGRELYNTNIGTPGTFQPIKNSNLDLFLVKLNDFGIKQWGTYYGGNGRERVFAICIDSYDNIYISGETFSTDALSTPGAHQSSNNSNVNRSDAFIAKFNGSGNRIWGTFYGGEGSDSFTNLSISNDDYLFATGIHSSQTNIATSDTYQTTNNGVFGGMIVKFDLDGNRIWGTYIADNSSVFNAELKGDIICIFGLTQNQTSIATTNSLVPIFQNLVTSPTSPSESPFIINFNHVTQEKIWGTYFYGYISDVKMNNNHEVFFSGQTNLNSDIATPNGFLPNISSSNHDTYIIKLDPFGQKIWGTYYGGLGPDTIGRLYLDTNNDIYLYGITGSNTGISTTNSHQPNPYTNNYLDSFLAKFRDCQSITIANSNAPICIGENLELTASGGINYSWTGPNGFTSTEQNPIIPNATIANNGQYSCAITGSTTGCDDTIIIDVRVGDSEAPIPTLQNLPTVTGDCNTTLTNPTATDNCAGTITATTTDPLSYTNPGNYTITWLYDDGNGNTSSQTQNIVITSVAPPVADLAQQFCFQDNPTINDIQIVGQNITWYSASVGGTTLSPSTSIYNATTYYASQTINGCESERIGIRTIVNSPAIPGAYLTQTFCASANLTLDDIEVTGVNLIWYDSFVGGTIIPSSTPLQHETIYYCTQTINGCESPKRPIHISLINTLNATNYSESLCDAQNDGHEVLNLANYNTYLIGSTGNTFRYYTSENAAENEMNQEEIINFSNYNLTIGSQIIYVRIDSPNTCHQIVELELTLYSNPIVNITDIMPICEGSSITITAGNGYDSYLWSTNETTPSIVVSQPGSYSVTVTQNHGTLVCTTTKDFTVVQSNIGSITQIISSDWTDTENTITVLLSGSSTGDYEYSLDGIHYQESNVFNGLQSGMYTVYINDKNGCGEVKETVYVFMYPKFFTPNGDGYNDFWKIQFSENEPHLRVQIFDRYGKFIKELGSNTQGWDGTYLGKMLPSTDYWFTVTRENGKVYKGHFSLKR